MSSQITDSMDIHYENYKEYFGGNEHTYLKIVKDILRSKGEKRRRFEKIFTMVRPEFLNTKTPDYNNIFNGSSGYVEDSIRSQRSRLKTLGVLDADGLFTEWFFSEYVRRYNKIRTTKKRLDAIKKDSSLFEDHTVELEYDYINTMDVLRETPSTAYHLPPLPIKKLDYFDTKQVQIIKMNHVGGNPVVQLPLSYHYRCNQCGYEADMAFDVKSMPCDGDCSGAMSRVKAQDIIRPAYASRVGTDDRNSIAIISLTEIPQGEFIGAVFLCRNKADYYLFMIATEEIAPTSRTVTIVPGRHALWQIMDQIDGIHEKIIGKHIDGLDWYKAAIMLAYLANRKGRISTNVMVVGGAGSGKTSTARLYMATLTQQQKVQPMDDLSGPGLRGSTAQIKIGDATISVPEQGLLTSKTLVTIDEFLGSKNPILNSLKTALVASTLNVEVAGNRTQTPKYATAIATSNTVEHVMLEQSRWMMKYIEAGGEDPLDDWTQQSAHDAMVSEWKGRGLEWHTGLAFPHIDRWPLLFFINDPSDELTDSDLDGSDEEIDDLELAKILYSDDIDEYFQFCGQIQVDWKSQRSQIKELVNELRTSDPAHPGRKIDTLHSKRRLGQNITLMLQLSAQINGRANLTVEDFEFVRELWSKTCEWIDISELRCNDNGTSRAQPGEWTIEKIMLEIRARMKAFEGSQRYYMTRHGYGMVAGALEDMGAPTGLVNDSIKRHRDNPAQ